MRPQSKAGLLASPCLSRLITLCAAASDSSLLATLDEAQASELRISTARA
ncbi:hypothetical protein IMZ48_39065 [Candidatus Bathyarchaeota archaeon]|nr:hypothetical protein [Candidatus Bathyarchaeota archaeon]